MSPKINYTVVGLFVILLTVALIIIGVWLSVGLSSKQYNTYLAYFDEAVTGLSAKAPVKYNGVDVGFVEDIHLDRHNPSQVIVILKVENDVAVKTNTVAVLNTQGLTGIAYINLKGGNNGATLLKAAPGQQYPVIKTVPSSLFQLENSIHAIADNTTDVTNEVKTLLDAENQQQIKIILNNLAQISNALAKNSAQLNRCMQNANVILENAAKASDNLPALIKNLNQASSAASGSLKAFSNQAMPQTLQALNQLQNVLTNVQQLTNKIEQNPAVLIRGEATPPLGPGE